MTAPIPNVHVCVCCIPLCLSGWLLLRCQALLKSCTVAFDAGYMGRRLTAWQLARRDVLSFPVAVQRLKAAAEAAKIALSSQTTTRVVIPDLLPGKLCSAAEFDTLLAREHQGDGIAPCTGCSASANPLC